MTLALSLVAARADAEGSSYFQDLSERNPADATAQALAGFFQVRAGHDVAGAVTNWTTPRRWNPACHSTSAAWPWRSCCPAEARPSAAADTGRAHQVTADLEFVLAARDQFPVAVAPRRVPGPRPSLPGARAAAAGGRSAATVRPGPGRGGPAADVHEFLDDCAGRDAVARARRAQPGAGRARRPVLRLRRLCVRQDKRGSRRHRRGQPARTACWPQWPILASTTCACQSPHPHARSPRPHRRGRGHPWP